MIAEEYPGLLTRPDEEKLQLASELLSDVLGDAPEDDPALVAIMESLLADYLAHPERVSSWSDVKKRLLSGNR
jgi:hypothetical protein